MDKNQHKMSYKCPRLFFVLVAQPTKTDQVIENFQLLYFSSNLYEIWCRVLGRKHRMSLKGIFRRGPLLFTAGLGYR